MANPVLTDQYVQLPLDATANSSGASGKKMDTSQVATTSGTVQRQRVTIGDPTSPEAFAGVSPIGVQIDIEGTLIFEDTFDGTLDTTNRWNTPISGGGGVTAANTAGNMSLGTGTTASGYSYMTSQTSQVFLAPGYLEVGCGLQFESGTVIANTYRFWGIGTVSTTAVPTAAAPLVNAIGWELYTDGNLYAVMYINSTRTVIQNLGSGGFQPTDGAFHRYLIDVKASHTYWFIDGTTASCATSTFQVPYIQTLPMIFMAVAATSAPASSGTLAIIGVSLADTGRNNHQISDGQYPWRKANVLPSSNQAVAANQALLVTTTASASDGGVVPLQAMQTGGQVGGAMTFAANTVDMGGQTTVSDITGLATIMQAVLYEIRALKQAVIQSTKAGILNEDDFKASNFDNDWDEAVN
jgi:hypothetical protein